MLIDKDLATILDALPKLTIGVIGDLFLDRYLEIDAALTELSLETGLDAYQVTRVRTSPGAAGTVINNLAALGAGKILPVSCIGDDGEGYELRQELAKLPSVDQSGIISEASRRTPAYTKPMLQEAGQPPRELNRIDIKNRTPLPADVEGVIINGMKEIWPAVNALLVVDQVSEENCGVVTDKVREQLQLLGAATPSKLILVDSRERIGQFHNVTIKPNGDECLRAAFGNDPGDSDVGEAIRRLAVQVNRPVFCTLGKEGILLARSKTDAPKIVLAFPVSSQIDIVGAGDSSSAAIACAIAAGSSLETAAAFGNLVASITIQQIGTTGTATPEQVMSRWAEVCQ